MLTPTLSEFFRERLQAAGCTPAESYELLRYGWNCPPKEISRAESVEGLVIAIERAPMLREKILELAVRTPEDRRRAVELARLEVVDLARANASYPEEDALREFASEARRTLRALWPYASESRINGALMVAVSEGKNIRGEAGWVFSAQNADRCMRETEASDGG